MKRAIRLAVGAGLLLTSLASCRTGSGDPSSHWNIDSVDERIVKTFTGYRGDIDGSYVAFQRNKKQHIGDTLQRHFIGSNPENPLQGHHGSAGRRAYGILPDPIFWFHVESIVLAPVLGGLPLDSTLALTTSQGRSEFGRSLTGDWGPLSKDPPSPSTFEVKHR